MVTRRSSASDFEFLGKLGEGTFGKVFRARRLEDGQVYVVKKVQITELARSEQLAAINEVHVLAKMDHPNVVQYFDSFIDDGTLHIVMQLCDRGDLASMLKRARAKAAAQTKRVRAIPEPRVWSIFVQMLLGLHYLHSQRVLHRDMKTANVFLCGGSQGSSSSSTTTTTTQAGHGLTVKIGDLGVAKLLGTSNSFAATVVGTPYYLSPELVQDQPYGKSSDMWALGVILYECCTLKRPFEANNQCALIMKIVKGRFEPIPPENCSAELIDVVGQLLTMDPRQRPSARALLSTRLIQEELAVLGLPLPDDIEQAPPVAKRGPAARAADPTATATPSLVPTGERVVEAMAHTASPAHDDAPDGGGGGSESKMDDDAYAVDHYHQQQQQQQQRRVSSRLENLARPRPQSRESREARSQQQQQQQQQGSEGRFGSGGGADRVRGGRVRGGGQRLVSARAQQQRAVASGASHHRRTRQQQQQQQQSQSQQQTQQRRRPGQERRSGSSGGGWNSGTQLERAGRAPPSRPQQQQQQQRTLAGQQATVGAVTHVRSSDDDAHDHEDAGDDAPFSEAKGAGRPARSPLAVLQETAAGSAEDPEQAGGGCAEEKGSGEGRGGTHVVGGGGGEKGCSFDDDNDDDEAKDAFNNLSDTEDGPRMTSDDFPPPNRSNRAPSYSFSAAAERLQQGLEATLDAPLEETMGAMAMEATMDGTFHHSVAESKDGDGGGTVGAAGDSDIEYGDVDDECAATLLNRTAVGGAAAAATLSVVAEHTLRRPDDDDHHRHHHQEEEEGEEEEEEQYEQEQRMPALGWAAADHAQQEVEQHLQEQQEQQVGRMPALGWAAAARAAAKQEVVVAVDDAKQAADTLPRSGADTHRSVGELDGAYDGGDDNDRDYDDGDYCDDADLYNDYDEQDAYDEYYEDDFEDFDGEELDRAPQSGGRTHDQEGNSNRSSSSDNNKNNEAVLAMLDSQCEEFLDMAQANREACCKAVGGETAFRELYERLLDVLRRQQQQQQQQQQRANDRGDEKSRDVEDEDDEDRNGAVDAETRRLYARATELCSDPAEAQHAVFCIQMVLAAEAGHRQALADREHALLNA